MREHADGRYRFHQNGQLVVNRNVSHVAGSFWLDLAMRTVTESPALSEALLPQVDGRQRIVIEGVYPEIDGGQFPIKRVAGESVVVEADIFADGHDSISCQVLYRSDTEPDWRGQSMHMLEN